MSLHVYLIGEKKEPTPHSGIYIRENGQTREIDRKEWDKRFPDREPVVVRLEDIEIKYVYSANITSNLGYMADQAGIYYALWRPEEKGWTYAKDIVKILRKGLAELKKTPELYKRFNPENGWGSYETLVEFVESYLEACKKHPDSRIEVSR